MNPPSTLQRAPVAPRPDSSAARPVATDAREPSSPAASGAPRSLTAVREDRWRAHPALALALRAGILLVPLAVATLAGLATNRLLGPTAGEPIGWAAVLIATTLVLVLTDRLARRLLPLAVLLRLTLVFPDRAPSRMHVAMRTSSMRRLRAWAKDHDRIDTATPAAEAAEAVLTLAAALNVHDRRTRGHSERVRALTDVVAEELELDEDDANKLRWGALLHDVGKLAVPAAILNKAGKPSEWEWEQLREHPAGGVALIGPLATWLGEWAHAIDQHHERWDGTGYPNGLAGPEITLAGRVVAVTDAFETMTEVRAYKRACSFADARKELVRCSGTQFDPQIVRRFHDVSLGRLHWAMGPMAWAAQVPFLGVVPRAAAQVGGLATSGGAAATVGLASVSAVVLSGVVVPAMAAEMAPPTPLDAHAAVAAEASHDVGVDGTTDRSVTRDARTRAGASDGNDPELAGPGAGAGSAVGAPGLDRAPGPPDHAAGPPETAPGPPDHAAGPPQGVPGPPDHAAGPPETAPGPPDHAGGPPQGVPGPPDHAGGPPMGRAGARGPKAPADAPPGPPAAPAARANPGR